MLKGISPHVIYEPRHEEHYMKWLVLVVNFIFEHGHIGEGYGSIGSYAICELSFV